MLCKERIILDRMTQSADFGSEVVNFLKLHECRFCDISIMGSVEVELDWAWISVVFGDSPFLDASFESLELV